MTDSELKNVLQKAMRRLEELIGRCSGNLKSSYLEEPLDSVRDAVNELELRESEQVAAEVERRRAQRQARAQAHRLYDGWGLEELEREQWYRQELGRGKLATHLDAMRLKVLHELIEEKRNEGVAV